MNEKMSIWVIEVNEGTTRKPKWVLLGTRRFSAFTSKEDAKSATGANENDLYRIREYVPVGDEATTPDMWWDDSDPETSAHDPEEILLENYPPLHIVKLQCAARLPDEWGFWIQTAEDEQECRYFKSVEDAAKALQSQREAKGE